MSHDPSQTISPPRPGPAELWAAVVLFAIASLFIPRPLDPYDYWEHLATGERILAQGAIVDQEPYASETAGRPFVNMYWLAELVYAGLHRLGGVELTVFAHGLLTVLVWTGIILWLRTMGGPPAAAPLAAFAGFCLTAQATAVRPQLLASALTLPLLALLRRNRASPAHLAGLACLIALWTSLHPSALAAALLVGLEAIALVLAADSGTRAAAFRTGALWVATASAALLVHPAGWRFVPYVLATSQGAVMRDNAEWMPIDWGSQLGHVVQLLALYGLLRLPRWRQARLRDAFTPLVLLAAATFSSRFAIWAGLTLPLFLVQLMPPPEPGAPVNPRVNTLVILVLAAMAVWMTPWLKGSCPLVPEWRKPLLAQETPEKLADFALAHCAQAKWFHAAEWGDYLLWRAAGQHSVFMYCRFDRFPPELWNDYIEASGGGAGWQAVLDRRSISCCLVSTKHQGLLLARLLESPDWEQRYSDDNGAIFTRRNLPR